MPATPGLQAERLLRRITASPWWVVPVFALLLVLFAASLTPVEAADSFKEAHASFTALSKDEKRGRYRSNWQQLETTFLSIYKGNPKGANAPKALYYVGRVNEELGIRSFLPTDFKVASDYYGRVAEKYATHTWADDAQWRQARVHEKHLKDLPTARKLCSDGLKRFPKGDMRERFTQCIADIDNAKPVVADKAPAKTPEKLSGANAGDAATPDLSKITAAKAEPEKKAAAPAKTAKPSKVATPNHPARLLSVRHQTSDDYTRIVLLLDKPVQYVHSTLPANKKKNLPHRLYLDLKNVHKSKKIKTDLNITDGILSRVRSGQNTPFVTRVVLDLKAMGKFKVFGIDSKDGFRLLVDVFASPPDPPSPMATKPLPVISADKRPVSEPRQASGSDDTPRDKAAKPPQIRDPNEAVVKKPSKQGSRPATTVATTRNPITETPTAKPATSPQKAAVPEQPEYTPPKGADAQAGNLVEQLGLTVGVIMLDPGHGGKDPGAYVGKVMEKDINLRFAKIFGKLLEREGFEVLYTRTDDTFIPLEERTAMANVRKADIFISIHANAYSTNKVHGMETYYLDLATSDDAVRVAARENAVSTKKISDLQFILTDLMLNSKMKESKALAQKAHKNALKAVRKKTKVKDMGVRSAPFYVLMGARMPSILLELGYLTNKNERTNLQNKAYLTRQAQGFVQGILQYKQQIERYAGL